MYITPQEITTHLGAEQIEAISNGDDTMLQAAIDGATVEAKGYLHAFDITSELAKEGEARNALLIIFLKDINTSLELRQDRYERAVSWLRQVQKGEVMPDLPALPVEQQTGTIIYNSNPKRSNHF